MKIALGEVLQIIYLSPFPPDHPELDAHNGAKSPNEQEGCQGIES